MSTEPEPPIACTLDAAEMPERLARWAELARHVVERTPVADGVRVRFDGSVTPAAVVSLVADELDCCAFLSFSIELRTGTTALEVTAPADAREIVDLMFPDAGRGP